MATIVGSITVTLRAHKRWWFWPALYLAGGCSVLASLVSYRAADILMGHAVSLLARYGIRVIVE